MMKYNATITFDNGHKPWFVIGIDNSIKDGELEGGSGQTFNVAGGGTAANDAQAALVFFCHSGSSGFCNIDTLNNLGRYFSIHDYTMFSISGSQTIKIVSVVITPIKDPQT